MNPEIEKKIERHDLEIEVLKHSFDKVVDSLNENTRSNHELIKTLTVYTTKHDGLEERVKELQASQSTLIATQLDQSNKIAEMKPVTDALRGFVWKVTGSVLFLGGGLSAIVIAMTKA